MLPWILQAFLEPKTKSLCFVYLLKYTFLIIPFNSVFQNTYSNLKYWFKTLKSGTKEFLQFIPWIFLTCHQNFLANPCPLNSYIRTREKNSFISIAYPSSNLPSLLPRYIPFRTEKFCLRLENPQAFPIRLHSKIFGNI